MKLKIQIQDYLTGPSTGYGTQVTIKAFSSLVTEYDSYKSPCSYDEYGINCEKTCSPTCLRNSCRNTDGRCRNCPAGLKGFNCTTGNFENVSL